MDDTTNLPVAMSEESPAASAGDSAPPADPPKRGPAEMAADLQDQINQDRGRIGGLQAVAGVTQRMTRRVRDVLQRDQEQVLPEVLALAGMPGEMPAALQSLLGRVVGASIATVLDRFDLEAVNARVELAKIEGGLAVREALLQQILETLPPS